MTKRQQWMLIWRLRRIFCRERRNFSDWAFDRYWVEGIDP